jgi:hypothetical protein
MDFFPDPDLDCDQDEYVKMIYQAIDRQPKTERIKEQFKKNIEKVFMGKTHRNTVTTFVKREM